MSSIHSDISFLFNMNKQKYDDLHSILPDYLFEKQFMNIFIDTDFLFQQYFISNFAEMASKTVSSKYSYNIAKEVINYIAHYRNYFNKEGVNTRVFLLHGWKDKMLSNMGYPSLESKKLGKVVKENTIKFLDFVMDKRVKPVLDNVPDVYILNNPDIDRISSPFVLHHNCSTKNGSQLFGAKKARNLFITHDKRALQYVYLFNECTIFNGRDVLGFSNTFDSITKKYKGVKEISPYAVLAYNVFNGYETAPCMIEELEKKPRKIIKLFEEADFNVDNYNDESVLTSLILENKYATAEVVDSIPFQMDLSNRYEYFDIPRNVINYTPLATQMELVNYFDRIEPDVDQLYDINDEYFGSKLELTMLL